MKKNNKRQYIDEDELPKALKKKTSKATTSKRKSIPDKTSIEKEEKPKRKLKKRILIIVLILLIAFFVMEAVRLYFWKAIADDMFVNSPSQVLDTDGKVIATIGAEKIKEPVEISSIPSNLKNAYVAIEDQRFYSHHGIDIRRTTSAIFSYIIHF